MVIANHPATWSDVVVLEATLGRRLHFVARQPLFRPWIRGVLLELFATLPIWRRDEEPDSAARNRETFGRCRALFRKGHVVAVFPEGVSGGDRDLLPLKTGAARLLLDPGGHDAPKPLLHPVAIRYGDRTAFRTPVTVAAGDPIEFDVPSGPETTDGAVRALTDEMARALERAMRSAEADPVTERRADGGRPGVGIGRRVLDVLAIAGGVAGMTLHAIPAWTIERAARGLADQPQQIAFARMAAGLVLIPIWYVVLATIAGAVGGGAWLALPLSAPALGALACREYDRRMREAEERS
jgi:1-acyl-sn-glycerol-3-phosphate acyltransferase